MSNNCYSFKQVGNSLSEGNKTHFRGIVESSCGHVTLLPYDAENVVKHNICTDAQEVASISHLCMPPLNPKRFKKSVGAVKSCTGMIYGSGAWSESALTVDPSACMLACGVDTVVHPNTGPGLQTRGPSEAHYGTKIVTPGYGMDENTGKWHRINTITNTPDTVIETMSDHPTIGSQFVENPDWETNPNTSPWQWQSMYGSVAGNNGKVYGIPNGASHVNVYQENLFGQTKAFWRIGTNDITGNAPVDFPHDSLTPVWEVTFLNKYRGGALAGNGCIYAHGERARSILKIDTSNDRVSEIPYPTEIINAMTWVEAAEPGILGPGAPGYADTATSKTRYSASGGSVLGGDGKVYNIPRGIPYLIWIDPSDDSIGFMKIDAILSFTGATNSWYGAAVSVGNDIFYAPAKAHKIMKVTLPDPE